MSKGKKMELAKSANELKNDKSIPTIGEGEDAPEQPWEEVKDELKIIPDMICIIPPEETDTGIILPDGTTLMDDEEYRPKVELKGDNVDFVEEGERVILHPNAAKQSIPIKFKKHKVFFVHQQFIMGKEV